MPTRITGTIHVQLDSLETTNPIEPWLAKIEALSARQLTAIAAVLEAEDEGLDALRKLIRLLPALTNPARALQAAYDDSRVDLVQTAYRLATIRELLEGRLREPESLLHFALKIAPDSAALAFTQGNSDRQPTDPPDDDAPPNGSNGDPPN